MKQYKKDTGRQRSGRGFDVPVGGGDVSQILYRAGLAVLLVTMVGSGYNTESSDGSGTSASVERAVPATRSLVEKVHLADSGIDNDASRNVANKLPYYNDPSFMPDWYASPEDVPADYHRIRAFSLVSQHGDVLTEADLEGKLVVANFFFASCPGICPMTMANMKRLQKEFLADADVVLLSHSVTPEADTVPVLHEFADHMGVQSGRWYLATGDRSEIYDLGKNYYFADEDLGESASDPQASEKFLHTESFYLLDADRRIRGIYNGLNTASVTQLVEDVRSLQEE